MYCLKCGTPNTDEARFCKNCGAPMPTMKKQNEELAQKLDSNENMRSVTRNYNVAENVMASKDLKKNKKKARKKTRLYIILAILLLLIAAAGISTIIIKKLKDDVYNVHPIQTEAEEDEREDEEANDYDEQTSEAEETVSEDEGDTSGSKAASKQDIFYVQKIDEISNHLLREMKETAILGFENYANDNWILSEDAEGHREQLNSMNHIRTLFLNAKRSESKPHNYVVMVFEQSITNSNTSGTVYYYTMYSDVHFNDDGKCTVDLTKTKTPMGSRKMVGDRYQYSGNSVVFPKDDYYYYDGFYSVAKLLDYFESAYGNDYTIEEGSN